MRVRIDADGAASWPALIEQISQSGQLYDEVHEALRSLS